MATRQPSPPPHPIDLVLLASSPSTASFRPKSLACHSSDRFESALKVGLLSSASVRHGLRWWIRRPRLRRERHSNKRDLGINLFSHSPQNVIHRTYGAPGLFMVSPSLGSRRHKMDHSMRQKTSLPYVLLTHGTRMVSSKLDWRRTPKHIPCTIL